MIGKKRGSKRERMMFKITEVMKIGRDEIGLREGKYWEHWVSAYRKLSETCHLFKVNGQWKGAFK